MENISYIYIYQFNNQHPEWEKIQTQSVMSAQLSIKKYRLKLWLISEEQSVQSEIKSIPNNNMGVADNLFQLSILEYKLVFIQKQISKLK